MKFDGHVDSVYIISVDLLLRKTSNFMSGGNSEQQVEVEIIPSRESRTDLSKLI